MEVRAQVWRFPTVLVGISGELRYRFISLLNSDTCQVLEADTEEDILAIVVRHSRPIHALLIDVAAADQEFLKKLHRHRPSMEIFAVDSADHAEGSSTVLSRLTRVLSGIGSGAPEGVSAAPAALEHEPGENL